MLVPSQTCVRCRSRRMKCDLRLPKCGSCVTAGVECFTVDPGLEENVPRSYIHSLQQRVEELEHQIRINQENTRSPLVSSSQATESSSAQEYEYMGLGTSLSLFDQLCRLSALFLPTSSTPTSTPGFTTESSGVVRSHMARPPMLRTLSVEVDRLLPPEVQRHLIDYFLKTISPEFPPLLSRQDENLFVENMNSLLPHSIYAKSTWLRTMALSIYAISARVLSRDFHTDYAHLEHICFNEVKKALSIPLADSYPVYYTKNHHRQQQDLLDQVTILCLCIIYELVGPARNSISLDVLNATQTLLALVPNIAKSDHRGHEAVSRLAFFLSQIEASLCLHFKRPSAQYHPLRTLSIHETTWLDLSMETLHIFQRGVESSSNNTSIESSLNSILSKWHHQPPHQGESSSDESPLLLTLYLHPAFSTNLDWLRNNNDPDESCPCSIQLLNQVAQAARSYLECIAAKQESQPILCICLTVERALQAGFVWVIYILYTIFHAANNGNAATSINTTIEKTGSGLLEPLTICQSILVSLTEKWGPGRPYCDVWNMIRSRAVDAFLKSSCNRETGF